MRIRWTILEGAIILLIAAAILALTFGHLITELSERPENQISGILLTLAILYSLIIVAVGGTFYLVFHAGWLDRRKAKRYGLVFILPLAFIVLLVCSVPTDTSGVILFVIGTSIGIYLVVKERVDRDEKQEQKRLEREKQQEQKRLEKEKEQKQRQLDSLRDQVKRIRFHASLGEVDEPIVPIRDILGERFEQQVPRNIVSGYEDVCKLYSPTLRDQKSKAWDDFNTQVAKHLEVDHQIAKVFTVPLPDRWLTKPVTLIFDSDRLRTPFVEQRVPSKEEIESFKSGALEGGLRGDLLGRTIKDGRSVEVVVEKIVGQCVKSSQRLKEYHQTRKQVVSKCDKLIEGIDQEQKLALGNLLP